MQTLAQKLEYWAQNEPQKIAIQIKLPTGYERITYNELWNQCLNVASELSACGLKAGDHVSIYGENSPVWAISYLSIHMMGGVVIPLDSQQSARNLLNIINFSDIKAIIADNSRLEELEPLLNGSGSKIQFFSIDSLGKETKSKQEFSIYLPSPDDLQTIVFTSGTTGEPKGVMLTCGNIISNIEALTVFTNVSKSDNILTILPLNHAYPCIIGLLCPLWSGGTVTFSHSLKSIDLLSAMGESGVTILPGVPKLFTLLDREIFNKVNSLALWSRVIFWVFYAFSKGIRKATKIRVGKRFFKQIHKPFGRRLRFLASGGAKLDPKVCERFLNLGFLMIEGYGLTETSAVSTLNTSKDPKPGTAGIPFTGVEIRIDSPDQEGVGEICIRGKNVMKGYYKNESATKEVLREGWFHTGDLGFIEADGSVVITGREKEVIVLSSGKNIYPEEVEKLYENIPFVNELCVLPSLDNEGLIKGLLMVVVPDEKELRSRGVFNPRERIRSELTMRGASLPSFMQITELVLYDGELPRTMLGKIRRNEVEKLIKEKKKPSYEEEFRLSPEEIELVQTPASVRFLKRLEEIADIKGPFYPSQELSIDLGLDSLTLVQITVMLENEFELVLKEEELPSIRTVGDILNRIKDVAISPVKDHIDLNFQYLLLEEPSKPLEEIFNLHRSALKRIGMRALQFVVFLIVKAAFRMRVEGVNKIPQNGAFLICPNHQSYIDPIVIFALLPGWVLDKLLFTGFTEIFSRAPLSWLVRPLRVISIGSSETFGESLRLLYDGLRRGMPVCIFPEGRRTPTGQIMPPRIGAGILSAEAKAPIVPILIDGATNTLSPIHPEFRFSKVKVLVGDPIEPPPGHDYTKEVYQDIVEKWRKAVLELEDKIKRRE